MCQACFLTSWLDSGLSMILPLSLQPFRAAGYDPLELLSLRHGDINNCKRPCSEVLLLLPWLGFPAENIFPKQTLMVSAPICAAQWRKSLLLPLTDISYWVLHPEGLEQLPHVEISPSSGRHHMGFASYSPALRQVFRHKDHTCTAATIAVHLKLLLGSINQQKKPLSVCLHMYHNWDPISGILDLCPEHGFTEEVVDAVLCASLNNS